MVLSANRVAWSAVVVARVSTWTAWVGATSVVEVTSEVAAVSAGLAGVTSVAVAELVVSAVTACSEVGVASRLCSVLFEAFLSYRLKLGHAQ